MVRHRKLGSTLAASIALLFATSALAQDGGSPSGGGSAVSSGDKGTAAGSGEALPTTGGGGAPALQDLRFLPGLRVTQSWSDNVLRRSDGNEKAGFVTEISPYVQASVNKSRLKGDLRFSIRNFYRTETAPGLDSTDLLRYALNANGTLTAPGNRFGLNASAFIQDIGLSPFGVAAAEASESQTNRRRYSGLALSPYLIGRFGSFADYRAEYSLRATDVSGSGAFGVRAEHRLGGTLSSGPRFSDWGWSLSATVDEREYEGGFDSGRSTATANLYYRLSPDLRVGVSANYSQIDGLDVDGKDYGVGPGVSIVWAPSSRTSLSAQWADQFYGSNSSLAFTHRARRFSLGLGYTRGVLTGSDASILFLNPESLFSGGAIDPTRSAAYQSPLLRELLESMDPILVSGLTTDVAVFSRRLTASLAYALPRGSLMLTAYRSTRSTAVRNTLAGSELPAFTGELRQQGLRLGLSTRLDLRSSVELAARVDENESDANALKSRFTTFSASFVTSLTSDTTAGIGVRRSVQKVSGAIGFSGYDENAIFGTLDTRF